MFFENTQIAKPSEESYQFAKELLLKNQLVAFATETVYGLGANALSADACKKIYKAKGRPSDNPLIVHVADKSQILPLVEFITPCAQKIIDIIMPESITIVLKKSKLIPDIVSGGLDTVAIRIPKKEETRSFLRYVGLPLAAPSANSSGRPSPTTAQNVYLDMKGKIPLIIDGGECAVGIESTVVDCLGEVPIILRKGKILANDLAKVCGDCLIGGNLKQQKQSPGTRYGHYMPKCRCYAFNFGDTDAVQKFDAKGQKVGILCSKNTAKLTKNAIILGENQQQIAQNFYKTLVKVENDFDLLLIELCENEGLGNSINDRIIRTCKGDIL